MRKFVRSVFNRKTGYAVSALLALAIVSCSGGAGSPEKAVKKMVHAYGGNKKISDLQSFVAKGFSKSISEDDVVVESYAFDMYRKGQLYKHKVTKAPRGKITNTIVMYYDGKKNYQWVNGMGFREIPPMEMEFLAYRFPLVLQWVQSPGRTGEMLPVDKKEGVIRLRYKDGSVLVTLALDKKTRLLSGIEVEGSADSSSSDYREMYDHYFDLDGIPFPAEFRATRKGRPDYSFIVSDVELKPDLADSLFRVTGEDTAAFAKPKDAGKPSAAR